jgi:hypothetical protein
MSSITSVSSGSPYPYSAATSPVPTNAQVQSDLQSLSSALQSGNLGSAQQAYATLQKDAPGLVQGSTSTSSNPVSSALGAVGKALSQGNVSGAQQAFASLKQVAGGRHHHHHHGGGVSESTGSSASIGSAAESATSSLLNVKV